MSPSCRTHRPVLAAAGALVASSLLLAGCGQEEQDSTQAVEQESTAPAAEDVDEGAVEAVVGDPTVTAEELVGDPASFAGETVAVEALVGGVIGERAFTLADDAAGAPAGPDELLLVIGPTTGLAVGDAVAVSGTVQEGLDQSAVEERFGVDWEDGALDDFAGGTWVDAAAIEPLPAP